MMVLTGMLHVIMEVLLKVDEQWLRSYNTSVAILWALYILWRTRTTPGLARAWGFRFDNFLPAWQRCVYAVVPATIGAFLYGRVMGRLPLPDSFWLIVLLYPVYGIAQQVALQVLLNRNLRDLLPSLVIRAGVVSLLFSAAHIPNWGLVGLTWCAGAVFTWIYERHPNVLAIGVAHGFLGAVVYYLVLGIDPVAEWNVQLTTL
jgi:hypothetical protein